MGERGPRPLPNEILRARGSWRADRNESMPIVERTTPTKPEFLIGDAGLIWDRMVIILERMGVISESDEKLLVRYCLLYSRYIKCEMYMMNKPMQTYPIRDRSGQVIGSKAFPETKMAVQLSDQLLKIERELGLTPSSRTMVKTIDAPQLPKKSKSRFFDALPYRNNQDDS